MLKIAILALAILSLVLPFILSGDRTLATIVSYTALALLTMVLAQVYLRRWARK